MIETGSRCACQVYGPGKAKDCWAAYYRRMGPMLTASRVECVCACHRDTELSKCQAVLRAVVDETWAMLGGGRDPRDRCDTCGLGGPTALRTALLQAEKVLR